MSGHNDPFGMVEPERRSASDQCGFLAVESGRGDDSFMLIGEILGIGVHRGREWLSTFHHKQGNRTPRRLKAVPISDQRLPILDHLGPLRSGFCEGDSPTWVLLDL